MRCWCKSLDCPLRRCSILVTSSRSVTSHVTFHVTSMHLLFILTFSFYSHILHSFHLHLFIFSPRNLRIRHAGAFPQESIKLGSILQHFDICSTKFSVALPILLQTRHYDGRNVKKCPSPHCSLHFELKRKKDFWAKNLQTNMSFWIKKWKIYRIWRSLGEFRK